MLGAWCSRVMLCGPSISNVNKMWASGSSYSTVRAYFPNFTVKSFGGSDAMRVMSSNENKISHRSWERGWLELIMCQSSKVRPYAVERLVTVLISSIDWIGFECAVKDDQEFSHRGG